MANAVDLLPISGETQISELLSHINLLKRKLEAKYLINQELKQTVKELKEGTVSPTRSFLPEPGDDVGQLKQKLEAKSVSTHLNVLI